MFLKIGRSCLLSLSLGCSLAWACVSYSDVPVSSSANATLFIYCSFWEQTSGTWQASERFLFERQQFDDKAQLTLRARFFSDGSLNFTEKYLYDAGQLNSVTYLDSNQVNNWRTDYSYTANKLNEWQRFNANAALHASQTHRYDTQGRVVEEEQIDADGASIIRKTYAYDAEGKLLISESFQANGELREREENHYEGAQLVRKDVWSEGNSAVLTYLYDEASLSKKTLSATDGELLKQWLYTYNVQDQLTSITQFQGEALQRERTVTFEIKK